MRIELESAKIDEALKNPIVSPHDEFFLTEAKQIKEGDSRKQAPHPHQPKKAERILTKSELLI